MEKDYWEALGADEMGLRPAGLWTMIPDVEIEHSASAVPLCSGTMSSITHQSPLSAASARVHVRP